MDTLVNLTEVYLAQNGIQRIECLRHNSKLQVLDLNDNRLERIENVQHLSGLTDFWARNNRLAVWDDVSSELAGLRDLRLVYLELNPLAKNDPVPPKADGRLAAGHPHRRRPLSLAVRRPLAAHAQAVIHLHLVSTSTTITCSSSVSRINTFGTNKG